MIVDVKYICPNVTVETEDIGSEKFFVLNDRGVCFRIYRSLKNAEDSFAGANISNEFECESEEELERYFAKKSILTKARSS